MTTRFRTCLFRCVAELLMAICALAMFSGCATQKISMRGVNPALAKARWDLAEARKTRSDPNMAVGHYLGAADAAAQAATAEPNEARLIYNAACQGVVVELRSSPKLWNRTETIASPEGNYRLRFAAGSRAAGTCDPGYFNFFRTPKEVNTTVPHEEARLNDWGGELVGVYKPADPRKYFLPSVGLAVPVTVALDFTASGSGSKRVRDVMLALYDPTRRNTVQVGTAKRPLAADFGAPLAYYPNPKLLGLMAMLRGADYYNRAGLYRLEPYDPDRIPVVLVHGLMSIPQMWMPTITAIRSDPELRSRYQFWVFAYPTGDPITLSALRLRENLAQVYQLYPKTKDVVLIGHSMGGLLSRMQATTTGRVLWDRAFGTDADRVYASLPPDHLAKRALIFEANPRVRRIVFICVPHRGSYLATAWVGSIGAGLIRLPGRVVSGVSDVVMAPLRRTAGLKRPPTGINGLSPRSPVLRGFDALTIHAPYHSIIGDRGRGDTPNSSDGVVPYWSSHLAGAESELIVPGPHGSYRLPQTINELKRILRQNLEVAGPPPQRMASESRTATLR
jgi:pimeloyl-ACP methyl ester carboxylesterase